MPPEPGVRLPSARPVFVPPRPTPNRISERPATPPPAPAQAPPEPELLREAQARVAALEAELAGAELMLRRAQSEAAALRKTVDEQAGRLEQQAARLAELEKRAQSASEQDDLTSIRGIGPAFERALKAHGVTRIAQIAAWQDEDVERIASLIKTRAERIHRDGWVSSARDLVASSP